MKKEEKMEVKIIKNILGENELIASEIEKILKEKGIFSLEILGSPGSGKTTLIELILDNFSEKYNFSVIEGDVASSVDSDRLKKYGIQVIQINTKNLSSVCHMEAFMVHKALNELDLDKTDFLIVENIGNLVCPASFRLGCNLRLLVLSVPEGSDKPLKYPLIFKNVDSVVVSKIDLKELAPFDFDDFKDEVNLLNKGANIFELSVKEKIGIQPFLDYISIKVASFKNSI